MSIKKEKAKAYFEQLRKLINKCPKDYELIYDIDKGLYMVPKYCEFDHGHSSGAPAILCSVGMSYKSNKSDSDGSMIIVSEGIDIVGLQAVSSNAVIET